MQLNTPADLLAALKDLHAPATEQASIKEYRYVVYVRKSTDQEEKQVRSLGDQILECKQYAERMGITLRDEDIVQEAESAKEPDIRPKFRKMIKDIQERGKYDGILSWHPDRLARNMKDAGEIIDLLDKGTIKDLKFVSFSFEKSTAGKMLLGIMFVMSKEYSDKLSDDVSRGNKRSIEEGKYINKNKHGYFKDANQHMQPDGENFLLVKQAFRIVGGEI
jgi:DNA invertase Pin-like site-specific DNA recombinase